MKFFKIGLYCVLCSVSQEVLSSQLHSQEESSGIVQQTSLGGPVTSKLPASQALQTQSAPKSIAKRVITSSVNQPKRVETLQGKQQNAPKSMRAKVGVGTSKSAKSMSQKSLPKPQLSPNALVFEGLQEEGIGKNTFLCPEQASGAVCSQADVDGAVGYDIHGGKTLQFFDNFVYWLQQKEHRRQYVKTNLRYDGSALTNKLNQEGWGATSAYCVLVSTDPMLQKVVLPTQKAPKGTVKVIAQLLYSGENVLQLWSQDVVFMKPGQRFKLVVSSQEDNKLAAALQESSHATGVAHYIEKLGFQKSTRKDYIYNAASDSPRMVRIQLAPIS